MLADFSTPWAIHVAVTLRAAEHIEAGTGEIEELARRCGAHAESLGRLLRHLVDKGLFEEPQPGVFALNDAARQLMSPGARLGFDLRSIGGRMAYAWSTLLEAVETGRPAYAKALGREWWDDLAAHTEIARDFDALMGEPGHGVPDADVLVNGDWETVRTVVDVGGGTGSLLAEVLRAHTAVRGILVDQPETVARSAEVFAAAGVSDRVTVAGQSFFDRLPAGADLYLLKSVLCDWPDDGARRILERCAEAAAPDGRVVLVNGVGPDEERVDPNLLMLVLVGGKDRNLSEFRKLAASAGLRVTAAGRSSSGKYRVECKPLQ